MKNLIKNMIWRTKKKTRWYFVILSLFITILSWHTQALALVGGGTGSATRPPISLTSEPFQPDLFTGNATTDVPIKVPPGRCGMEPELSLIYFSGNGNSWVGVGWDFCPGRIDKTESNTYEFYFQGTRTKLASIGGGEYRAKTETEFFKFYFNGTSWQVWDKEGTKYTFGSSNSSRLENSLGTFQWFLEKEVDINGNYITYFYTKDQGQVYLSHTEYAGNENTSVSPTNTIDFILENRNDAVATYNLGSEVKTAKRLRQIDIKVSGALARRYILGYDYSIVTNRSLLTSLTEYGSDGQTSYPPITFSYHQGTHQYGNSSPWISSYATSPDLTFQGDFNGDNIYDIGALFDGNNYPYSTWKIAFSNGQGSFGHAFDWTTKWGTNLTHETYGGIFLSRDFDGDGMTDLGDICVYGGVDTVPVLFVALCTGSDFFETYPRDGYWGGKRFITGDHIFIGDFNGDNKEDMGGYYSSQGQLTVRLSNGHGLEPEYLWADNISWAGVTGIYSGDVNGDSFDDLLAFYSSDGSWYVALSTGYSFKQPTLWKQNFATGTGTAGKMIGDFNGDGLTDIGIMFLGTDVVLCFSGGSSFGQYVRMNKNIDMQSGQKFGIGDFNGDRIDDVKIVDYSTGNWYISLKKGTEFDFLKTVNNGIGGKTTINYTPSFDLPNTKMVISVEVVSSVTQEDGLGNSHTTTYSYSGGQFDSGEKEFRGFNYVKVTDPEGNTSESWFHQDDIYKGKAYKIELKDSSSSLYTKTINNWENTSPYSGVNFPYLATVENYTYDGDSTYKMNKTIYEYDTYGNITKAKEEGDINVSGDERETVTEYVYNSSKWIVSCPSHTYTLASNGTTKVRESWYYYDNNGSYTSVPTRGNLTKEENWLDTGSNPITTYAYDDYGNLISTTDARGNTEITAYDSTYHTYPVKITKALGHVEEFTYEPKTGEVLTKKDGNGNLTTYEYDPLGRLTKMIGPNDSFNYPMIECAYDLTTTPVKTAAYIRERSGEASVITVYTFYDGLGRQIQMRKDTENDTLQSVDDTIKFNSRGLVEYKWLPYFANKRTTYAAPSSSAPKIIYQYDALGRIRQVTNADGTYSTKSYSDWTTTETDENGHIKVFHHDAYGNIVQVKEHNKGTVYQTTYTYDTMENLLSITDNQGNTSSITYDSLGRKVSMSDPDMGSWSYRYDANGNLTSQTDAKGQIITFSYDALNRIIKKDYPTGVDVIYAYDEPSIPNAKGRLTSVIDTSGSTVYHYDNMGRRVKTIKKIDGTEYVTEKTYDLLDRVITHKYPDGETITYTYNKSAGIEKVVGDVTYVSDINYNASEQMTYIQYGNGNYTNYTYNANTLRLERIYTKSGTLQDLSYQYDNVGNILKIVDSVNTASQTFQYDDLNRLTHAQGSYGSRTSTYDSIGNILEKNGVHYTYGQGAGPHAVASGDDGFSASYDANGNMLSKNEETYEYDYENRLIKTVSIDRIEADIVINLGRGWNFISQPLIPDSWNIDEVLSSIKPGTDYIQVSRYNPQEDSFENFVGNSKFNQFDTLEYGRGYQAYVVNPSGCTLTLAGRKPDTRRSYSLSTGWNLVSSPVYEETAIEEALSFLEFGVDYDLVGRYNNVSDSYDTYPGSLTTLKPAEAYWIYCLKPINYSPPLKKETTEFVYDASGSRVKKITSSGTTIYIGQSYEINNGIAKKYIFIGDNRIASRDANGKTYFYHSDHINGTNVVTNSSGLKVQLLEYTPFGETSVNNGSINVTHKFTGKELDNSTGLYYYGARYYNASLGRFITPDSFIQAPYDPQSLNRYAYCRNNPVRYIDPSGNFWLTNWFRNVGRFFGATFNRNVSISHSLFFSPLNPIVNTAISEYYTSINRYNVLSDLGYSRYAAFGSTLNLGIGDFVGYTTILEGAYGVDTASLRLLSGKERAWRVGLGTVQTGLSIYAGAYALGEAKSIFAGWKSGQGVSSRNITTFRHYGYAEDADLFKQGLREKSFATHARGRPMKGITAREKLGLHHHAAPPDSYYKVKVDLNVTPVKGPKAVPNVKNPGIQYRFPKGTPPGSVEGPFPLK